MTVVGLYLPLSVSTPAPTAEIAFWSLATFTTLGAFIAQFRQDGPLRKYLDLASTDNEHPGRFLSDEVREDGSRRFLRHDWKGEERTVFEAWSALEPLNDQLEEYLWSPDPDLLNFFNTSSWEETTKRIYTLAGFFEECNKPTPDYQLNTAISTGDVLSFIKKEIRGKYPAYSSSSTEKR